METALTYTGAQLGSSNLQAPPAPRVPNVMAGIYILPHEQLVVSHGGMYPCGLRPSWEPETPRDWALRTDSGREPDGIDMADPLACVEGLWAHHDDGTRLTIDELRIRNARIDAAYAASKLHHPPTPDLMRTLAQAEKEIHNVSIDTERPTVASQVMAYMAECPSKVTTADIAAALVQSHAAVGSALAELVLSGDLEREGNTRGRKYWNPHSLIETPVEPDPDPVEAPAGARHALEDDDDPIAVATDALTHRMIALDVTRDQLGIEVAALEAQIVKLHERRNANLTQREQIVNALDALKSVDDLPVAA